MSSAPLAETREGPGGATARLSLLDRITVLPILPVLLVAFLLLAVTAPGFATGTNLETMARVLAPLLIAAVGGTFVMLSGGIDLSVGAVMSLASVVGALAMRETGSVGLGVAAGAGVGLVVGTINGIAIARWRLAPFVHTLAMLLVARAIAFLVSRGASIGQLPREATAFGRSDLFGIPSLLLIAAAIFALGLFVANRTVFGRAVYLIGSNERAAIFNAVPVARVKLLLYALGGTLAGLAGMVAVLRLGSGSPVLGDNLLLQVIAAIVVGGTSVFGGEGGLLRTLTGVALIVILDKGLDLLGLAFYDQAIVIGLVILAGSALGTWLRRRKVAQPSHSVIPGGGA